MKSWPILNTKTLEGISNALTYMIRERGNDIKDFDNLNNVLIRGRLVLGRTPSSSADVIDGDKIGDFSYSTSYLYILMDNAGTATWRRVALSSW